MEALFLRVNNHLKFVEDMFPEDRRREQERKIMDREPRNTVEWLRQIVAQLRSDLPQTASITFHRAVAAANTQRQTKINELIVIAPWLGDEDHDDDVERIEAYANKLVRETFLDALPGKLDRKRTRFLASLAQSHGVRLSALCFCIAVRTWRDYDRGKRGRKSGWHQSADWFGHQIGVGRWEVYKLLRQGRAAKLLDFCRTLARPADLDKGPERVYRFASRHQRHGEAWLL